MARTQISCWLDRLDSRPSWQFLGILYIARWALIILYMIAVESIVADERVWVNLSSKLSHINPALLFLLIVVISPLFETLLECSLPFFLLSFYYRKKEKPSVRPWLFIIISAVAMTLLHLVPSIILPAFISGVFLAYCYAYFAPRGFGYAVTYTTAFHGAINIVGWTMIVFGGNA